jgi:hypothetical protein
MVRSPGPGEISNGSRETMVVNLCILVGNIVYTCLHYLVDLIYIYTYIYIYVYIYIEIEQVNGCQWRETKPTNLKLQGHHNVQVRLWVVWFTGNGVVINC